MPSGVYHVVENLTEALSINHNWANPLNIVPMAERVCRDQRAVVRELGDSRAMFSAAEFSQICAAVLECQCGFTRDSFRKFARFSLEMCERRHKHCTSDSCKHQVSLERQLIVRAMTLIDNEWNTPT